MAIEILDLAIKKYENGDFPWCVCLPEGNPHELVRYIYHKPELIQPQKCAATEHELVWGKKNLWCFSNVRH